MPIPLLIGGLALGAGLLGSAYINSQASNKASAAQQSAASQAAQSQQQGQQQAIAAQQAMHAQSLEAMKPYREAGGKGLAGLQGMIDPAQRGQMLGDYYQGDEFKALQGQETEQQLRNSAATGGVRGGVNQAGLSSIAPRLGRQYMQGMQNQYGDLANMGMGVASQGARSMQNLGNTQANIYNQGGMALAGLQQQAGQAQAQNALTQGGIWGGLIGDAGGMIYGSSR